MKSPCCGILAILLIIVICLQIWTIKHLPSTPVPTPSPLTQVLPTPTPTQQPSSIPVATPAPTTESKLLFERNNIAACSYTDTSTFKLKEAHTITKLQTWYSWSSNEITLDYKLKQGYKVIREGVLVRKDCDPYQRQWCQAVEENLSISLDPGDYQLVADTKRICQNSGSDNDGFIFVYGN